jgi:hypothetical protein
MAKEYARPLMPVKAKLILLTPAATDQKYVEQREDRPRQKASVRLLNKDSSGAYCWHERESAATKHS